MHNKKWEHNPGSEEAVKLGCTCAVIDNHYGRGYHHWPGKPEDERVWMISGDCPLHAKRETEKQATEIDDEA